MIRKEYFIASITTLVLFLLGFILINSNSNYMDERIDELSAEIVQSQASVLERSIKRSVSSAVILSHHINTVNGDMSDFNEYAHELYSLLGGITNLQLAPNGIVTKIYPLEGHEKAIGHDIFKSDDRKKEAFIAQESKELTLAGPFSLIQGGVAIIARHPVFLYEYTHQEKKNTFKSKPGGKFWGFASTLVYLDDLLKTTDLNLLKKKNYLFRIWRYHPDTGKINIFAGSQSFPNQNIFTKSIDLPNSTWFLDIAYIGSSFSMVFMYVLYAANFFISILLGYLMYAILNRPNELKREVNLKTNELKAKNNELVHEKLELKKLSNAVTYNNNAIFITTKNGIIEYINPMLEKMTGYSLTDIQNENISLFKKEISTVIQNQTTFSTQNVYRDKYNQVFVAIITISVIKDLDENVTSYVGVCQDITQKMKNEKVIQEKEILLLQQSKMASMGEMLRNIAHQWRQPLSVISVAASGLKFQYEMNMLTKDKVFSLIDKITSSSDYLSTTIDDFSNFFKPEKKKKFCSTNKIIKATLNILEAEFKNKDIVIIKEIEEIVFSTYQNELIQVLINILNNAKEQLSEMNIENKYIFINIYKDDDLLYIKIKDNADGIKEPNIHKVFEPYFTTKEESRGTGIGLYMSKEIITKHMKGELFVKNNTFLYEGVEYKGAEFTIQLSD